jgi:hypothetical protein
MVNFDLPVSEIRGALNVLKPNFDISEHPEAYVRFEDLRPPGHLDALKLYLNISEDVLDNNFDYAKILFTGHTGSGKTTELKKLELYLNHKERYFTVFADVQESFQITTFEQEDLYILLISKLVEALKAKGVRYNASKLENLASDWIKDDEEISKEIKNALEASASAELESNASLGVLFWKLFSIKGSLKTAFAYDSSTSTKIRQVIKANKGEYIKRFNEILIDIRHAIIKADLGQDIIFIIDGVERLRQEKYDIYINTFFRDARLLQELNTNFICCVPIETRYDIHIFPLINALYKTYDLPLLSVNDKSIPYFKALITNRIKESYFFEQGILAFLIEKSGGHPRQLLQLVEKALTYSLNNKGKINQDAAQKASDEMGRFLRRLLTAKHIEILKSGEFSNADDEILELLFSTSLFEYNGEVNARKINPVLIPFVISNG